MVKIKDNKKKLKLLFSSVRSKKNLYLKVYTLIKAILISLLINQ